VIKKVVFVFGTRPEGIKLAPLISEFRNSPKFDVKVCVTGQHKEMLEQVLRVFEIEVDTNLEIMEPGQGLEGLTARSITLISDVFKIMQPDLVIVQGDTTTTFTASLCAFYQHIPIWHIEAGLRTGNLYSPWPEEANRKMVSAIADYHFAPTQRSRNNLLAEGIAPEKVCVTGNTVIDALFLARTKILDNPVISEEMDQKFPFLRNIGKFLLVTGHRRENFGIGLENICNAINRLADEDEIGIVFPVHLNPNVRKSVNKLLGDQPRIHLIEPVEYLSFVYLMNRSYAILTDSGGVQEEAPSLGKPVLVTRDTTERPEGVESGTVKLVGTNSELILSEVRKLWNEKSYYKSMSQVENPYGDGEASGRILKIAEVIGI